MKKQQANYAQTAGDFIREKTRTELKLVRNHKDRLFRHIASTKENLLQLYNAVNQSNYEDESALEVVTLENAIYMSMKNDLAFIIEFELNLYEQQSTFSPNMPYRFLIYVAEEYQKLVDRDKMYRSSLAKIPTPRFFVFYNGKQEMEDVCELKLSDAFLKATDEPQLELKVVMLNVNYGKNKELMAQCKWLMDYAVFVQKVRKYGKEKPIENAVEQAIDECIKENHLKEYFQRYRSEAIAMSIYEYNEEQALKYIKEDEYSKGIEEGIKTGMKALVNTCKSLGATQDIAVKKLVEEFQISENEAFTIVEEYWK